MKRALFLLPSLLLSLASCQGEGASSAIPSLPADEEKPVMRSISKAEYRNKTLGGLLGQMAGFLSGYEFVWDGPLPRLNMPESWYQFCNGPYAGNFEHYFPPDPQTYDRLQNTGLNGEQEIACDDDFHLDLFNQTILDEYGRSSKAISDAWFDYKVSDWGGGVDAMALINCNKMLSPYTGSIEAGNRYGWCTEAYIENETLGMNAPGMPNLAIDLVDTFASNVGYYDSVVWAKFYATAYSLAYFESDVRSIIKEARKVLPEHSWPAKMFDHALALYEKYPNDRPSVVEEIVALRRNLYRLDNVQTDPNVNGAFAVLSWLYGGNSYMDCCKHASLMGYDGDCTAATVTGLLGIVHGFKEGNPEYPTINDAFYHGGEGTYFNDSAFTAHIGNNEKYPTHAKLESFIDLYVKNFEKLLIEEGGRIMEDTYEIPTTSAPRNRSFGFANGDAEQRGIDGFAASEEGALKNIEDSQLNYGHAGNFCFQLTNGKETSASREIGNLRVGKRYRAVAYVKTTPGATAYLYAKDGEGKETSASFQNQISLIQKDLVFEATAPSMEIGFRFALPSNSGDVLSFDDFFIEELSEEVLVPAERSSLVAANNSYTKALAKPASVKEGREVVLRFAYAQKTGASVPVSVYRNNELYGTVMASSTGLALNTLSDALEIPYVFSSRGTDYIKLDFPGSKISFGAVEIVTKTPYLYR